jgi:lipoprotein-anchoring transpeptidase ErfK/SrfK
MSSRPTSRFMLAAVLAGGCLAGCASTQSSQNLVASAPPPSPSVSAPPPPQVADVGGPPPSSFYAEAKDGGFTVPAVKAGQVDQAFLRRNVAFATKEPPGTIVIDPVNHYH